MNRIRTLATTPLLTVERFDHPEHDGRADGDEQAQGFAVSVVERGSFRFAAGGASALATVGSVLCTSPSLFYRCEHGDGAASDACLTLSFGPTIADDVLGQGSWPGGTGAPIVAPSNRRAYAARQVVEHLDGPALTLEAAGLELVAALAAPEVRPTRLYRHTQIAWYGQRLARARERIDSDFGADHSLASLAREAGMSPFHFSRVFSELVGVPPHQYVLRRRLDAAARMLASGARVSQAAAACGFSSSSYFARAFKRRFRTAPMLWRPNTRRSQRDPPS